MDHGNCYLQATAVQDDILFPLPSIGSPPPEDGRVIGSTVEEQIYVRDHYVTSLVDYENSHHAPASKTRESVGHLRERRLCVPGFARIQVETRV